MVVERRSFFVAGVDRDADAWRLRGEPGFGPRFRPVVGTRFDGAVSQDGAERAVDLEVVEVLEEALVVRGVGGDEVRAGDVLVGEVESP